MIEPTLDLCYLIGTLSDGNGRVCVPRYRLGFTSCNKLYSAFGHFIIPENILSLFFSYVIYAYAFLVLSSCDGT